MALGYPMAFFQFLAAVFLIASGIRLARIRTGIKGITLGVILVVVTGAICLVANTAFALWNQIDLLDRSV